MHLSDDDDDVDEHYCPLPYDDDHDAFCVSGVMSDAYFWVIYLCREECLFRLNLIEPPNSSVIQS